MKKNHLQIPIGIKFFHKIPEVDLPVPKLRSYCEGLGFLREGRYPKGFLITKENLGICIWGPVALGFREPRDEVDGVAPTRYKEKIQAVLIFNAEMSPDDHPLADAVRNPDVVTLLTSRQLMEKIVIELGPENLGTDYLRQVNFTANDHYLTQTIPETEMKIMLKRERNILAFNHFFGTKLMRSFPMLSMVSSMMKRRWMQKLMTNICMNHTSAMGMCFSAAAYPYQKGKANITFSDPGAVGWGGFNPDDMTIGMPGEMYKQLRARIS